MTSMDTARTAFPLVTFLVAGMLGACIEYPDLNEPNRYACTDSSSCADGYYCGARNYCVKDGSDPCLPDPCNGHGSCANTTGAAVCDCNTDWATPWCAACQSGFYEYPALSGLCIDDPCLPDPCSGHGNCDNTAGTAGCTCSGRFAGATCTTCAEGYTGTQCDACTDGAFGNYPNCFVPGPGFCVTSQCFPVPPTNQTTCYNNNTNMACTAFPCNSDGTLDFCGQDAQYTKNNRTFTCYNASGNVTPCASLPSASADEAVSDSLTGLMWQRTWVSGKAWQQAIDYCDTLTDGGYGDWRLPSPHELLSIVNNGTYNPAIDTIALPGTPSGDFWSSSSYVDITDLDLAWLVNFDNGNVDHNFKSYTYNARCARLGPSESGIGSFDHLVISGSGEQVVSDSVTGLMWAKQYATGNSWQDALKYCEGLTYAGYADWRLPDKNELASLVNYSRDSPASGFPDMASDYFWSSSSYAFNTYDAWGVYFDYGRVGSTGKSGTYNVRCARHGP
jgi:hypothetical protein